MPGFTADIPPNYFSGEDVIGDALAGKNKPTQANRIPQQLLSKLNLSTQQPADYPDYTDEEINISQPISISHEVTTGEIITKNIKINLEINLKINVI
jgi:hypothetical protein